MNFDSFIEDTMDDAMKPYTSTEAYASSHADINREINLFRNNLTSETQRRDFLRLINMINSNDADFAVNAYITAFKCGMTFCEQNK